MGPLADCPLSRAARGKPTLWFRPLLCSSKITDGFLEAVVPSTPRYRQNRGRLPAVCFWAAFDRKLPFCKRPYCGHPRGISATI